MLELKSLREPVGSIWTTVTTDRWFWPRERPLLRGQSVIFVFRRVGATDGRITQLISCTPARMIYIFRADVEPMNFYTWRSDTGTVCREVRSFAIDVNATNVTVVRWKIGRPIERR